MKSREEIHEYYVTPCERFCSDGDRLLAVVNVACPEERSACRDCLCVRFQKVSKAAAYSFQLLSWLISITSVSGCDQASRAGVEERQRPVQRKPPDPPD